MDPLPQAVYAALADPAARAVDLPAGRYAVTPQAPLNVTRSGVRIRGEGCTLCPTPGQFGGNFLPLKVWSAFLTGQRTERHFAGTITPATDSLTLADLAADPYLPGDVVMVRMGVSSYDPAEPESQVYATVLSWDGTTLRFTMPLGRCPTVYASLDALKVLTQYPDRVGAWGGTPSRYTRGTGTDHGVVAFAGGRPLEDVSVEGVTVEWDPALSFQSVYGAWSFSAQYARRVRFSGLRVTNPRGSCLHLTSCEDSGVDGLEAYGDGYSNDFGGASTRQGVAKLLTLWGGQGVYARGLRGTGRNLCLVNAETHPVGTRISDVFLKTALDGGVFGAQQLNVAGQSPGFTFENVRLDCPRPCGLEQSGSPRLLIRDLAFDAGEVLDYLHLSRMDYDGTIRVGRRVFGPRATFSVQAVVNHDAFTVTPPPGLYKYAEVVLSSRDGLRNVTTPTDLLAKYPAPALVLPCLPDEWGQVPPGDVAAWLGTKKITVWQNSPFTPVTVAFRGEFFPG